MADHNSDSDDAALQLKRAIHMHDIRALEQLLLLDRGGVVDRREATGLLHDMARAAFFEGVAMLLLLGADPRDYTVRGVSAFEVASAHCGAYFRPAYCYLMRLLETRPPLRPGEHATYHDRVGRDVNAPIDGAGPLGAGDDWEELAKRQTPVIFAAMQCCPYGLVWLVEGRGARLDLADARGRTAIGCAMAFLERPRLGTNERCRALFMLRELLMLRYGQDPMPYEAAYPAATQALRARAARKLVDAGFFLRHWGTVAVPSSRSGISLRSAEDVELERLARVQRVLTEARASFLQNPF